MTSNALLRAHQLISRAYELPAAERDAFLHEAGAGDPALQRELSWMLAALHTGGADDFLEHGPATPAQPQQHIHASAPSDYTIVRQLGEGGMGVVYLAERCDGEYRQQVALKMLNIGAALVPALVERFLAERQIVAGLNHPNIAHLVDGGTLADGRPFLALEYIEGEHIDHWCATRELAPRPRVELFLKVCAAVNHAHQRLVIHRDIKPSNILVTTGGEPKLLDFGIARLLDASLDGRGRTATGMRLMTLAYASPEQLRGELLGTATDVYSLGMVLYELLAGAGPWRSEMTSPQLMRAICEDEPAAPSSIRARLSGRRGDVPRDLDAIVLKALRKAPAERYESVQSLVEDLRRWLDVRPVLARRGQFSYRASKWIARHRFSLSWTVVLLTAGAVFLLDSVASQQRTETQRRRAEQVSALFQSAFVASDPQLAGRRASTAEDVLDAVAIRATGAADMSPDIRAESLEAVGTAYWNYRESNKAAPLLLGAWALRAQLAQSANVAADLRLSAMLGEVYMDAAQPYWTDYWKRRELRLARDHYGVRSLEAARAEARYAVYLLGWTTGRADEIRALARHATAIHDGLGDRTSADAVRTRSLVAALALLDRRYADAVSGYRELLEVSKALNRRANIVYAMASHADALLLVGDLEQASVESWQAIELSATVLGPRHPDRLNALALAAAAERMRGDWVRAMRAAREAQQVLAAANVNPNARIWALHGLVPVLAGVPGGAAAALTGAREAMRLDAAHVKALSDTEHMLARHLLALALVANGESEQALTPARESLQLGRAILDRGGNARELFEVDWVAGDAFNAAGRFELTADTGAITRALHLPWPSHAVDLLRAEARFRLSGDADARREAQAIAQAIEQHGHGRCTSAAALLRRVLARSPDLLGKSASWAVSACDARPRWDDVVATGASAPPP